MDATRCIFLAVGLVSLTGCPGNLSDPGAYRDAGGAGTTGDAARESCEMVVTTLFANTCAVASCHASMVPAAGVDLETQPIYSRLVGQALPDGGGVVIAKTGGPAASALYEVLASSTNPPGGSQMPLGEGPLSSATINCVAQWITDKGAVGDAGAGDDGSSVDDASGDDAEADGTRNDATVKDANDANSDGGDEASEGGD